MVSAGLMQVTKGHKGGMCLVGLWSRVGFISPQLIDVAPIFVSQDIRLGPVRSYATRKRHQDTDIWFDIVVGNITRKRLVRKASENRRDKAKR